MTIPLQGRDVSNRIAERFPAAITEVSDVSVAVKSGTLLEVAAFLNNEPSLQFDYLSAITAVDYLDYFELVYQLVSMKHNHSLFLKTRLYDRENAVAPSVVGLWRGADYQEREIFDLLGIKFEGHPNLKHIVLWEGFEGYPLRKDYLTW